jgi:hypothetical protein
MSDNQYQSFFAKDEDDTEFFNHLCTHDDILKLDLSRMDNDDDVSFHNQFHSFILILLFDTLTLFCLFLIHLTSYQISVHMASVASLDDLSSLSFDDYYGWKETSSRQRVHTVLEEKKGRTPNSSLNQSTGIEFPSAGRRNDSNLDMKPFDVFHGDVNRFKGPSKANIDSNHKLRSHSFEKPQYIARSNANTSFNEDFDDMKEVLDILRDDFVEDSLLHYSPIHVESTGVETTGKKTMASITFDEELSYRHPYIRHPQHFRHTRSPVMHVTPLTPEEKLEKSHWLDQRQVTESPPLPMSAPSAIHVHHDNCACTLTKHKHWTEEEDEQLKRAIEKETMKGGKNDWKKIARRHFGNTRSGTQCKVRWKNHLKPGIMRGNWHEHEDKTIIHMVEQGKKWAEIAQRLPGRIGENVRERYVNVLDPSLKKTPWTEEEDKILFDNQASLGNRWSEIRNFLPGRSENSIKNRYHNRKNSHLRKMKRQAEERALRDGLESHWATTVD